MRGLGRATAILARKVFWEAVPVAEVAAPVLPDQASSVLLRADAASIPPLNTQRTAWLSLRHRTISTTWYVALYNQCSRDILRNEIPRSKVFAGFDEPRNSEYPSRDYNTVGRCPSRE